ncbi:MAG TPA: protease complex subunit PrcB family protein [Candidatus Limnocylindria bacterium]|nr:protease complex subunit PrcB family protein [Candidatus Limnocylindria bacterium]
MGLLLAGFGLAACGTTQSTVFSSIGASSAPGLTLRSVQVAPVEREQAAIAMAFDADEAAALVASVPDELDFNADALVCVYLGERPTTGWGLDLQTASLMDGELRILARETRPRGSVEEVVTYPGDCGVVNRNALPVGDLAVRADDTISDEFIVGGDATVPVPESAP